MALKARDGWPGFERVFDWSFYSQGTSDTTQASSDAFVAEALEFFGDPDPKGTWGYRFEGFHLSLNVTVVEGRWISVTPSFFGAIPAVVPGLTFHLPPDTGPTDTGHTES